MKMQEVLLLILNMFLRRLVIMNDLFDTVMLVTRYGRIITDIPSFQLDG